VNVIRHHNVTNQFEFALIARFSQCVDKEIARDFTPKYRNAVETHSRCVVKNIMLMRLEEFHYRTAGNARLQTI
jgi:hypothetical protein